jgi:PTS system cellobiose-specific IIC component
MLEFFEKYLFPLLTRLGEARHLRAIRDGIVAILPLIIAGSFFLLLAQLPGSEPKEQWGAVQAFLNQHWHAFFQWYVLHHSLFLVPYLLTMKIMALYAAFSISASLAKTYDLDPITAGILGMASLLLTIVPQNLNGEWFLPLSQLGGQGLFLAIILGLFSAELYRVWEGWHLFDLPAGVPPSVVRAFSSIVPSLFLCAFLWGIRHLLGVDLQSWVLFFLKPIEKLGDTLTAVVVINIVIQLIWFAGIHGVSVMNALFLSLWMDYLAQNAHAMASGLPAPFITAHPFYQWFVWVGGSGTTLGLSFLLLFSKAKSLKSLGKLALVPSLCNINEPIIFGLPIVLNPIMAFPFITAPAVSGAIAYLAMKWSFVQKPYIWVPWTLPSPLGAFLCTGYDWRAVVLFGIIFFVSTMLYFPFFKQLEAHALMLEKGEALHEH